MSRLNAIRELVLKQDKELEKLVFEYTKEIKKESETYSSLNLSAYKSSVKLNFELLINEENIDKARELIEEYKQVVNSDDSIYSMEGILLLQEGRLEEAFVLFESGLEKDNNNVDLLYNTAYVSALLGDMEFSIQRYMRCIELTEDDALKDEINNILIQLTNSHEPVGKTVITIGIDKDDIIFNNLKELNVISILENDALEYEKKYIENNTEIYEVNKSKYIEVIDHILKTNENCIFICGDSVQQNTIKAIKEKWTSTTIYYSNNNLYTDKDNHLDKSISVYMEKEIINMCDYMITNSIEVYAAKRIIERRKDVYIFIEESKEALNLNYIIEHIGVLEEKDVCEQLKIFLQLIEDEYTKSIYLLASEVDNRLNCIEVSKYIYEKYETELIYKIYVSLLSESKDYLSLLSVIINSKYCDDAYKAEMIYLKSIENEGLIDFQVNLSIRNYKLLEKTSNDDIDYKMASYNFELNQFEAAYSRYFKILADNKLVNSPMVNRNIGYIMYANGSEDYKKYYDFYSEVVNSLK